MILSSILLGSCTRQNPAAGQASSNGTASSVSQNTVLKVLVSGAGIYELGAAELVKAGFPQSALEAGKLRLYGQGQSLPYWSEGQGKSWRMRFYAQATRSVYTDQNVYWLASGDLPHGLPGEPAPLDQSPATPASLSAEEPLSPPGDLPSGAYFATNRQEENLLYNPQVESGDHWLWSSLSAPQSQSVDVPIEGILPGPGRLQVTVWASTESPEVDPDHYLKLQINGREVGDQTWDGKGRHTLTFDIPQGVLKEGQNQVVVEAPGLEDVPVDIIFLDWLTIGYPRAFQAQSDSLDFVDPGSEHQLAGFSGPVQIFDVSNPPAGVFVKEISGNPAPFQGEAGHHYLAVGAKGALHPEAILPASLQPDLRASDSGADYLAVGPAGLLAELQPLLDQRRKQGFQVNSIPVEAVYDQFNGGLPEPGAIRLFLRYAQKNWQPAPHYLLLVGDATYDPKGYISPAQANRLPVFMVNTVFGGETASDVVYSLLDEDLKPDLAIGRVPAANAGQVSAWVKKELAFEQGLSNGADDQSWRQHVLAIADGQDASFRADAQSFLDLFPENYQPDLFAPQAGATGSDKQILEQLQRGDGLVAYFGHGSVNMWGKDRLFTTEDVGALQNGNRLPVVLNLNCLTGLFTHPKVESLAEALLWKADGGAVAVLAPSSLTLPEDQNLLMKNLIENVLSQPGTPLGDDLLSARRQMPLNTQDEQDVLLTFMLFGDPALRWQAPATPSG